MNYKIALIRGDGIGPEIVNETVKVIDKVGEKFSHSFDMWTCCWGAVLPTQWG